MILKHKDRELLRFDWIQPFGVRNLELDTRESQFLPLAFRESARKGDRRELVWKLENWLMHRTAPLNRQFVRDMMIALGFNPSDPRYLVRVLEFCRGLSLNDVHWLVPDDFTGSWSDCNLYANSFPESVATLAFSGTGHGPRGAGTTSPEYTTDGMLAKCWRRTKDGIFLYKAGSEAHGRREPLAEFYAAQVSAALQIDTVPYRLVQFKGQACSVCPLFTSETRGFLPVGKILTREEILKEPRFADIFLLDALILNDDRHLGNFGFLIDNDTNEICGIAPAFDNGHAFWSRPPERFAGTVPALYENWADFPGFDRDHVFSLLSRLKDFHLHKDRRFNLPDEEFQSGAAFLARRIDALIGACAKPAPGGPVNIAFTGPADMVRLVRDNPGLRTRALAQLAGISERTAKRYLGQLKKQIVFKGAPKTGGYWIRENNAELARKFGRD